MTALDAIDVIEILDKFCSIQGMMSRAAGASFVATIAHQAAAGVTGPCIEFGVYKGRSAYLIDALRKPGETLDLVDIHVTPEVRDRFGDAPGVGVHEMRSSAFHTFLEKHHPERRYRVIHVDGNHTFDNVAEDLRFAETFLAQDGICILDDYENPNFPQVPAATFQHLYTTSSRLRLFAIGANKAFLCDEPAHEAWMQYMLTSFVDDMAALGETTKLSKSDINPKFDVVAFMPRGPDGETIYGPKLYGHLYEARRRAAIVAGAPPPGAASRLLRRLIGR